MAVTTTDEDWAAGCLNRKTLIVGDVNRGKTQLTLAITESLQRRSLAAQMVLLDLAPQTTNGIGGKMTVTHPDILVFSPLIYPPRLTGGDNAAILRLAQRNACIIEPLLQRVTAGGRTILIVNDLGLYLQAGEIERFLAVLNTFPTAVLNAYMGDSFRLAPFTEREKQAVLGVARACDRVIEL